VDEAMLAVLGSITAALLGGIVGATIEGRSARRIDQERETRNRVRRQVEIRAAARLVFTDLEIARLKLEGALDQGRLVVITEVPTAAWRAHGVLLAADLPADDYDAVAEACAKVAVWESGTGAGAPSAGLLSEIDLAEYPGMRDAVENLLGMCLRACEVLHPLAYGAARPDDN